MLAFRYIKTRKRNKLMSFLSITSIVGIMLGVATLIIVVNVMSGFMDTLREKLLGTSSDIKIVRFDGQAINDYKPLLEMAKGVEGVKGISPYITSQVLISSEKTVEGALINGIEPQLEKDVSKLETFVTSGSMDNLSTHVNGMPTILLGRELALRLNVFQGEQVTVISPHGSRGPFGLVPKMKKFVVAGFFDTGVYEYNSQFAYVSIQSAQDIFRMGDSVSGLSVSTFDANESTLIADEISSVLKYPYWARDWISMNQSVFSALALERLALFIVLTLIVIVASFNIISMISITIKDRRKDIAILRAYGASGNFITSVFVRQGLIVGITGTILGNLLALTISFVLRNFELIKLQSDVYFGMTKIPVDMNFGVYLLVTACAVTISFLASIFPARQAVKYPPIVALRND